MSDPRTSRWLKQVKQTLGLQLDGRPRDEDVQQATVRVAITGLVLAYALGCVWLIADPPLRLKLATVVAVAGFVLGCAILLWLKRHSRRTHRLRLFTIGADMALLTLGLAAGGDPGVVLIFAYPWIVVGNGLRFGPRYLSISYWISLPCFAVLLFVVPYWSTNVAMGIGFLGVLALIPRYVLTLLSRIVAQKEAAEQLSNAKSRFVANVSHELRTPLAGVFAVYDLIRGSNPTAKQRELIDSMGEAIGLLKGSVDSILQMSKLEAGAERTTPEPFNLRAFLRQVSTPAEPQAKAKGLAWSLEVDGDVPTLVHGDVDHLQHVLGNLVNNAIKFTAAGSVRLKVLPGSAGRVRFEVIDTGIGIAPEQQARLFERFVQADDSATRRFGGTGLGTSIAHDLVDLMGGEIGIISTLGSGSTFWVELPLPEATPEQVPVDWAASRPLWLIGRNAGEWQRLAERLDRGGLRWTAFTPGSPLPPERPLLALLLLEPEESSAVAATLPHVPWACVGDFAAGCPAGAAAIIPGDASPELLRLHAAGVAALPELTVDELHQCVPAAAPCRILLADDNHSNRLLFGHILRNAGHEVVFAGRGDEAYDRMVEGNLDLAILDLNMPEMTGPDAIKLYRAGETGAAKRLPVLILSADATPAAREESLAAGADDYLTKPVTAARLLEAVVRYSGGRGAVTTIPSSPAIMLPITSLLDRERLEALAAIAHDDTTFFDSYVTAAFDDIATAVQEVRAGFARSDERFIRDALHKIEGTAASVGARGITASSKGVREHLGATPGAPALEAALAELEQVCTASRRLLAEVAPEYAAGAN